MPKRRKQDNAELAVQVFARYPWWVPVVLAFVLYGAITGLGPELVPDERWEDVWPVLGSVTFFVMMALGIGVAAERSRRKTLVQRANTLEGLRDLTWREFEELCAEAYRRQGYAVRTTAEGADGGVDLVLRKGMHQTLVQCKRYKAWKVDVRTVRELFGVMAAEGARAGIVITSGRFTKEAIAFARGKNLTLVDGAALVALLRPVQDAPRKTPDVSVEAAPPAPEAVAPSTTDESAAVDAQPVDAPRDADAPEWIARVREQNPRAYLPWTPDEDQALSTAFRFGQPIKDLAQQHQRTMRAIAMRLEKLGLLFLPAEDQTG